MYPPESMPLRHLNWTWKEMTWTEATKSGLMKAGTVLKFEGGSHIIVGNINEQEGECGCCWAWALTDAKIIAYANLLEGVDLNG